MPYTRVHANWLDAPATTTPVNAAALNQMESGIEAANASLVSGTGAVLVASTDAPAEVRAIADFQCDGTADQVQVQAAIDIAAALQSRNALSPSGAAQRGKVQLTGGRFNFSAGVNCRTGVWIDGMGSLTEIRAVACNSPGLFNLATPSEHLIRISNMYWEGNASSGGSCGGVYFDYNGAGSDDTSSYPNTDPDADCEIYGIWSHLFSGGSRNHITITGSGTTNSRGHIIHDCQLRICSGTAVLLDVASDSFVYGCHVGGAQTGYNIGTGNCRITHSKAYFCDVTAFSLSGSRMTGSNLESQDSATGYLLSSGNGNFSNITADTCSADGIKITTGCQLQGGVVYMRGGGRYATCARGFNIGAGLANLYLTGTVYPGSITTPVSGTAHATQAAGKILNGTTSPFALG